MDDEVRQMYEMDWADGVKFFTGQRFSSYYEQELTKPDMSLDTLVREILHDAESVILINALKRARASNLTNEETAVFMVRCLMDQDKARQEIMKGPM